MNIIAAIQNSISISQFNRGLAGKIFQDVKNSGAKVVMKNNAPECVLLSPDEYVSLMDEVNDARLLTLAVKRMEKCNPESAPFLRFRGFGRCRLRKNNEDFPFRPLAIGGNGCIVKICCLLINICLDMFPAYDRYC